MLNEQDREWIKLIAKELARDIIQEVLIAHIDSCPYGKKLLANKWFLIGVSAGVAVVGGSVGSSVGFGLAKLLSVL